MKKIVSLLVGAVMVSAGASAQILWKVEKPGSDKVSYILGTHHFATLDVVDALEQLPSAISKVDKLYGELDMAQMMEPSNLMKMQQMLAAPADSTLDKVLTPVQLDSVKTVINSLTGGAVPAEMLYPLKPAGIATQIAAMMSMQLFPEMNPMEGLDKTMQDRAKAAGVPVAGLETLEFQMERLYGTPISKQAEGLMKTVNDFEGEKKRAFELSDAYKRHDIVAIEKAMIEEESDPEEYERLLYSRNDTWVKQLKDEMADQSLMVVVGAGHLPGERGVLQQLRNAGYTVTPAE